MSQGDWQRCLTSKGDYEEMRLKFRHPGEAKWENWSRRREWEVENWEKWKLQSHGKRGSEVIEMWRRCDLFSASITEIIWSSLLSMSWILDSIRVQEEIRHTYWRARSFKCVDYHFLGYKTYREWRTTSSTENDGLCRHKTWWDLYLRKSSSFQIKNWYCIWLWGQQYRWTGLSYDLKTTEKTWWFYHRERTVRGLYLKWPHSFLFHPWNMCYT